MHFPSDIISESSTGVSLVSSGDAPAAEIPGIVDTRVVPPRSIIISWLNSVIMKDVYSVFREEVKKRRNLSEDIMEEIATGLVFSAEQAKKNGLIDGIANLETVVDELKAKTGTNSLKNLTPKKPFISRLMSLSFEAIYNVIK